jgi:hypothetical protein
LVGDVTDTTPPPPHAPPPASEAASSPRSLAKEARLSDGDEADGCVCGGSERWESSGRAREVGLESKAPERRAGEAPSPRSFASTSLPKRRVSGSSKGLHILESDEPSAVFDIPV